MKKVVIIALILIAGAYAFNKSVPKAYAGESKVYNWSDHVGVYNCEKVLITEDFLSNGEYLSLPGNTITRMYGWGPTIGNPSDHKLSDLAIDADRTYFNKLLLTADTLVPNGADNYLKITKNIINPLNPVKRNFFMRQDPNTPRPVNERDPNIYDLLDLTDYFTQDGKINLPNITSSTPRGTDNPYDSWNHIVANYVDLHPSVSDGNIPDGKVNLRDFAKFSSHWQRIDCNEGNHWCNFADLDRDGIVDYNDLGKFSGEWLYDTNNPNTW